MLPSFPTYSKDTDIQKQMASMRSYLNILKDDIEAELANIGYGNLDEDLRGRFDSLNNLAIGAKDTAEAIAGTLKAKYITASEIASTYVTTQYLTANYITASQISANYASFAWVEALDAMVGNLNAKAITTDNLSAQTIYGSQISGLTISANQITSGTISSDRVDFSTGIASTVAVNDTLLVGYKRYASGSADYYVEINRYGITYNRRGYASVTWQWTDAYNNK